MSLRKVGAILLTRSNNQFRNYDSDFHKVFDQLEQVLQVFFVVFRPKTISLVDKLEKLQELYFQNWLLDPVSKIINILLHLCLHKKCQDFKSWIRQNISREIVR